MRYICPEHKLEFVSRPAGVSRKTGLPYEAFWTCPTYGCRQKPLSDVKQEIYQEAQSDQIQINNDKYKDEQKERSFRIERQHSQEMAIRYLELKYKYEPPKDTKDLAKSVKWMTDWFMKDLLKVDKEEEDFIDQVSKEIE